MKAFSRKLQLKFQGVKTEQNLGVLNVIANYVHKTWLNGSLVLNESYNI